MEKKQLVVIFPGYTTLGANAPVLIVPGDCLSVSSLALSPGVVVSSSDCPPELVVSSSDCPPGLVVSSSDCPPGFGC